MVMHVGQVAGPAALQSITVDIRKLAVDLVQERARIGKKVSFSDVQGLLSRATDGGSRALTRDEVQGLREVQSSYSANFTKKANKAISDVILQNLLDMKKESEKRMEAQKEQDRLQAIEDRLEQARQFHKTTAKKTVRKEQDVRIDRTVKDKRIARVDKPLIPKDQDLSEADRARYKKQEVLISMLGGRRTTQS